VKPFRERNPIPIAIIGIVVIAAALAVALNAGSLPFVNGGPSYSAAFTDRSGLNSGDDVRVAGVKVGQVDDVALAPSKKYGKIVKVDFHVDDGTYLGAKSTAAIKIKTLLGAKYVDLTPTGDRALGEHATIPVARTTTPFDVTDAFVGLGRTTGHTDKKRLAKAFNTLSSAFKDTPPEVHSTLTNLARVSKTVYSRDAKIHELLAHANNVSHVLASRDAEVTKLVHDGQSVLALVQHQKQVIDQLLRNTSALSKQITGLVKDNRGKLKPALTQLHSVLNILQRHDADLKKAIPRLSAFVRYFSNAIGNGSWFDTTIYNLPPSIAKGTCLPGLGLPPPLGCTSK
jgi:phospholipid/cholesterol/gamma-HCH transport system substrate-binding protein